MTLTRSLEGSYRGVGPGMGLYSQTGRMGMP